MFFDRTDQTICAFSTPPGSTIGIIRVSGKNSFSIASSLCNIKNFKHMCARLVKIKIENEIFDKCLVLPFKAPSSFTGEDVIEFHTHGSLENSRRIFSAIISSGAVAAINGEFSFRAVMNSKMEISEAIALDSLIRSESPVLSILARNAAFNDTSYKFINELMKKWEHFYVLSTAVVDFPDAVENNISISELTSLIFSTQNHFRSVLENTLNYETSKHFSVIIAGKPNVGKSSLFNIFINKERAIISNTAGTTRDYLSDSFFLKGFHIDIIDSAGFRKSNNEIEKEGIEKSRNLIKTSDLTIVVLDASIKIDENDYEILSETSNKPRVIAINKSDITSFLTGTDKELFKNENAVIISCKTGEGIETLKNMVFHAFEKNMPDLNKEVFFNTWQKENAEKIITFSHELETYIKSDQIEIINLLIKDIFFLIKDLSGDISSHSVYEKIFSGFCVGK